MKCIEDEIPFELPQGWEWCRLRAIFTICSSKRVTQSEWKSEGIPFYRAREIVKLSDNGFVNNDLFISEDHYWRLKESYGVPQAGDLMVTGVGTIGKTYIVKNCDRFYYKDASVLCFQNRSGYIVSDFAKLLLDSSLLQRQIHSKTYGNTVDTITISTAENYICALPPLQDQKNIVSAFNSAMRLYKTIDGECIALKCSIATMKSRILDLAIRGKLVPQDPNDEPASVLLERIRAEKEDLIRQGKIKPDKKESVIFKGEDNSYYQNLPKNWTLTTLADITTPLTLNDGDWILSENMDDNGNVKLIQLGAIGKMQYIDKGFKFISDKTFNDLKCSQVNSGFLLINRIISDAMNVCILPTIEGKIITTVDTCWIAPNENNYSLKYLMFMLSSSIVQSKIKFMSSGTTRKRISKNNLIKIPFPFPPLAEQHRIVYAIETYFSSTLDKISNCLS